jgi:peptide/nickel transport system substrate-binding protein
MSWARPKTLSVFLAAAFLALALAAQAPAAPAARRGGTLRIANIGDPPTLDMSATTVGVTSIVGNAIYETLFAFDAAWRPVPHLAESSTVSGDGKTYTIRLRRAVPFHNGKEMTADDVAASLTSRSRSRRCWRSWRCPARRRPSCPRKSPRRRRLDR